MNDLLRNVLTLMVYLAMLALVFMYFTGNGSFIYEAM